MPISATGPTERAATRAGARQRQAAFTLLEVLVVLAIIAVLAALAVLSTGGLGGRTLENAARRAEALVSLACERAALTGRDVGMAITADGLRFGYLVPQGFQPVPDDPADPLRARPFGERVSAMLEREGEPVELAEDPPSAAQLACTGSGELTPFTLWLSAEGTSERWQLRGRLDGTLQLERHADAP